MEIENHKNHLAITFDRLINLLGFDRIMELNPTPEQLIRAARDRVSWIRTADLAVPEVTTETMVLHHLLWLQHIGRVVVEDSDPYSGAVRIRVRLDGPGKAAAEAGMKN